MTARGLRWVLAAASSALAGVALGCPGAPAAPGHQPTATAPGRVSLQRVADGLERPLFVTHAGDGSGRLFLVEQGGTIRLLKGGRLLPTPFLDLSSRLDSSSGERGLLGLAFPPDFASTARFYVAHTAPGPQVRVTRYRLADSDDRADPASASTVLAMPDPASNHNGGMIAFGPDGMLWIGTGDGGRAGDPWDNARDPRSLLGKLLRLDVRREPYAVPGDNPFVAGGGAPEVWALGLRNPWRFSFDRATGDLWIGDVGQNAWEEIDRVDPRRGAGTHFGWKTMEGTHCYAPRSDCPRDGLTLPIHEYGHDLGCSVTGGYIYRGRALPELVGAYLFADYCTGTVWALRQDAAGRTAVETLLASRLAVSSFGEDEAGELYLVDHRGGAVYRLVPAGAS